MYQGIKKAAIIMGIFLSSWLFIQYFLPLFFPFILGTVLALAAEPMVSFLCKRLRLPRFWATGVGVTAAFAFLTLAILLILALLIREVAVLVDLLPNLEEAAESGISALSAWVLQLITRLPAGIRDIMRRSAEGFFSESSALLDQAFRYVISLTGGILSQVPDSALILATAVISSYMISGKLPKVKAWLRAKISGEKIQKYLAAAGRMKTALFGWIKAQFKLMGVTWLILTMALVLLRVTYAPLWAAAIALVDTLPVLGTGTVLIPWSLICFVQGDSVRAVGLLAAYTAITLIRSALEPKLVGKQLGLDPLVTLASIYAGYRLWGLGGMILAPVLAVVTVQLIRSPGVQT